MGLEKAIKHGKEHRKGYAERNRLIGKRRDDEKIESSQADYEAYGTELTRMDGTMGDLYGEGSNHRACPKCGMCVTCGDCAAHGCGRVPKTEVKRRRVSGSETRPAYERPLERNVGRHVTTENEMACPKCGCKTAYQYDDDEDHSDDRMERCAACGEVFDFDDHSEGDDDEN